MRLLAQNAVELAKNDFERILEKYPTDYFSLIMLGHISHKEEDSTKRSFYAEMLFKHHNDKVESHVKKIGDKLLSMQFDSANFYLELGLGKFPDDTILLGLKRDLYEKQLNTFSLKNT